MPTRRYRSNRLIEWRLLILPEDTSNQGPLPGRPVQFHHREGFLKPVLWTVISIVTAFIIGQF